MAFEAVAFVLMFIFQTQICTSNSQECLCNATNQRCDHSGLCRCDPGWEGPLCARCALMPGCVHGSCELPWQCVCREGWGGRFCSKDLSACRSAPCLHGGTCVMEDSGDVACLCADGYHGDRCQLKAGPCHRHRSACLNGGQCDDGLGFAASLSCRCLAGFSGARCELDVDDCAMSPCANGATCTDGVNRFTCTCAPGFAGRFCSVNVDECASRPCANGGRCLDLANGYRCLCRHGYAGPACTSGSDAVPANRSERTLRVTLSERGPAPSLSRTQVVTVVTLAAATLALVSLTATLVLHSHCGHAPCRRCWGRSSRTEKVRRWEDCRMGPERVFPNSDDDVRDEERFPTATAWSEEEEEPNAAGGGAYLYQPLNQEPISHEPMNDEEEDQEAEPEGTLQQRMEVMGLHLPEAPPPELEEEDRDWAEAQRSRASIPMDADHVELVKRTMASLSFSSLGVPPWAQQISDDQWKDLVQTTLQKRHQD